MEIGRAANVTCPILILHGDADSVIAQWHGKKLFDKATAPKRFVSVPGADHNNLAYIYGLKRYQSLLADFALNP